MKNFLAHLIGRTEGNVLAIAGAGMFALIGGAGLGTDTIQWFLSKRQLQQAVESGALAGAQAAAHDHSYSAAATSDLNRNANTVVTIEHINNPPTSGAFTGDSAAVEVIASTSERLPFSSLFLSSPPVIRARAVAALVSNGEHCLLALSPTGVGVNVAGTANIELGCGVAANSEGAGAIYLEGSSWLAASPLSTVGGIRAGDSNVPAGTDLQPYGVAQSDPMAGRNLEVPAQPSTCTASNFEAPPNRNTTVSPGRYCGGMALKGDVTLNPGVYIIDRGSFYVASQARIIGEGVTIVLTGSSSSDIATITIAGGSTVDLRAPTAAEDPYWKNVLVFQDPRAESQLSEIAGGSTLDLQGIVYMPKGDVRFAGSSGHHAECLFMVVNRITLTGTTSITNACPADFADADFAARRVRVVE